MICLDTNVVIGLMNRQSPHLRDRFEVALGPIALSVVTLFELRFGIAKSNRHEASERQLELFLATQPQIYDFDADDSIEAAEIRADLARLGTPIGPYDILIAAQARRRGATLVTANTREFSRVQGLKLEDWTQPRAATPPDP